VLYVQPFNLLTFLSPSPLGRGGLGVREIRLNFTQFFGKGKLIDRHYTDKELEVIAQCITDLNLIE
jgi:hypothetical protein